MIANRLNPFLREKAGELAHGGGAAVVEKPGTGGEKAEGDSGEESEEEESEEEEEEEEQPEARVPSVLERAAAAFQGKGKLLARANDAEAKLATAEQSIAAQATEIEGLKAKVAALTGERDEARAELTKIDGLLKTAESERQTVEEAAAERVAGLGFNQAELPKAETEPEDDIEAVHARMLKATDPTEKAELARQVRELRWAN